MQYATICLLHGHARTEVAILGIKCENMKPDLSFTAQVETENIKSEHGGTGNLEAKRVRNSLSELAFKN